MWKILNLPKIKFIANKEACLSINLLLLITNPALSLDLKIDLPPNEGKLPLMYPHFLKNATPNSKNLAEEKAQDASSDIPENPIPAPQKKVGTFTIARSMSDSSSQSNKVTENYFAEEDFSLQNNASAAFNDKHFPLPHCLIHNVKFWEKVYKEVDVGEAIVHDRTHLGIIYGVVELPAGKKARADFAEKVKNKYSEVLFSLADKIHTPRQWNKEEKRIASLFPNHLFRKSIVMEAASNIRFQEGLKNMFLTGVHRSLNYLPVIYPYVKQAKLPLDVLQLPHVESSFNPNAMSKVGAEGLWQMMPGTMSALLGKHTVKKRRDPVMSTIAAVKLLQNNYKETGSWPLAITAYNHGLNGMKKAVRQTGSTDICKIIRHYDSSSFKFASANFYAQFLAARNVAFAHYRTIAKKEKRNHVLKQILIGSNP